jgi:hypothetical protein
MSGNFQYLWHVGTRYFSSGRDSAITKNRTTSALIRKIMSEQVLAIDYLEATVSTSNSMAVYQHISITLLRWWNIRSHYQIW